MQTQSAQSAAVNAIAAPSPDPNSPGSPEAADQEGGENDGQNDDEDFTYREQIFLTTRLPVQVVTEMDNLEDVVENMLANIITDIENLLKRGSGLIFKKIIYLAVHIHHYQPQAGGCYLKLPKKIAQKQACIQVYNTDEKCFL